MKHETKFLPPPQEEFLELLPLGKHLDREKVVENSKKLLSGESLIGKILVVAIVLGVAYGAFTYVLPVLLTGIAHTLALLAKAGVIMVLAVLAPVLFKALRRFSQFLHRLIVKYDPFGELDDKLAKMKKSREKYSDAKAKVRAVKKEAEQDAMRYQNEMDNHKSSFKTLMSNIESRKATLADLKSQRKGETDEAYKIDRAIKKQLAQARRESLQMNQKETYVRRSGTRAHKIKVLLRNLEGREDYMDILIDDFALSIDMMRADDRFALQGKKAASAMKGAVGGFDMPLADFAFRTINQTIAENLSHMEQDLSDVNKMISSDFSIDDDTLFAKLDQVNKSLVSGETTLPKASSYTKENYKLTDEDRLASGGMADLFED